MSETIEKKEPENESAQVNPEQEATVKVSMDKPEMGVLPGGLFVVSVPINSKTTNRIVALGWIVLSLFKINKIYEDFEGLKKRHQDKLKCGDLSLAKKIKDGISSILNVG